MRLLRFSSACALGLVLFSAAAFARPQDVEAKKVIELGRSENLVMEHLDHLANRIGPRLTSSDGFKRACAWAREEFEKYGLKNCHIEAWGEFPVGFNRGPSSGRMISPEKKELHFGTNAWTAGTVGPESGPAVLAPANEEELASVRGKLKGAWVVVPPTPPRAPARRGGNSDAVAADARGSSDGRASNRSDASGTNNAAASGTNHAGAANAAASTASAVQAGGRWVDPEPSDAARRTNGAPGTNGTNGETRGTDGGRDRQSATADRAFRDKLEKIYDEEGVLGTIRATRNELILTGGSQKIAFDKLPTRPSINLLAAECKEIVDHLKAGEEVRLEFDIRNWFEKGPIVLENVIAEIPGTEKPDEVVIVGGHLDSWDGATGATDNGTGVATTLEAARLLAKAGVHPKRTIRFMLWGGEEEGLLGSHAYVEKHKDEMAKISAVLVHDGGTNYCAGITATPPMVKPLETVFAPVENLDPEMPFKVREVKGLSGGGSDHASFLTANVPGFFWTQKGRANYNHTHHTQYDTYDAAIPEYQKNSSIVIAVGALGIANLPDLLSRENLRAPGGGGFGGRRLGIQLSDDMTIEEVTEDGLAAKAGIAVGDRLVKVGDQTTGDRDAMRTALQEAPAKTKVVVLRKGKEMEFPIEFPPDPGPAGMAARRLGVVFGDGLTIDVVTPGSLADQAGLQAGDKITKIGDTAVAEMSELGQAVLASGTEARVSVMREGKPVVVTLKMPERP
jgi:Peptidase family M28/PDZ domain